MKYSTSLLGSSIHKFLNSGHKRSVEAKKNILWLFGVKGMHIAINMALVPITIRYINTGQYGIWLTLSSIMGWFAFFDIGLSNGLRNKFAEAKARGDLELARSYISTTYAALMVIFSFIWLLFIIVNRFIDWTVILNAPEDMALILSKLAFVLFSFFCLQIVLKTLRFIIIANQEPAKSSFIELLGQLLALVIILVLVKTTQGSILYLGIVMGICPVVVFFASTLWFFKTSYKSFAPSFSYIHIPYGKEILSIGVKFFVIQVATIVIYQTNNLVIAHIGSPEDVTVFNVAYKYMAVVLMSFTILITPYWSAITEAHTLGDFHWIKSTVKKLRGLTFLLTFFVVVLLVISDFVYYLWIGDSVTVPFSVTLVNSVYIILLCWALLNTSILNGTGKITIQLMTYMVGMLFHIPTAIFFGNRYGIVGVILSACIYCAIIAVFSYIQVNKIMNRNASGLWNA